MEDNMLEVVIETKDEQLVQEVESGLQSANPKRWEDTRDLVTVIAIVSSIVTLIKSLMELKEKFSKKPDSPKIVIYNINREAMDLKDLTEDSIKAMLEKGK